MIDLEQMGRAARQAGRQLATLRRSEKDAALLAIATAGVRGWLIDTGGALEDQVALVPLAVTEPDLLGSAVGARAAPQWIVLPITEPSPAGRLEAIGS